MLQNASEFARTPASRSSSIPGQAMPLFNGAELRDFIEQADYVTVNDYESQPAAGTHRLEREEIAGR